MDSGGCGRLLVLVVATKVTDAYKGGINVFDPRASSISLVILSGHRIAL